ncbi:GNAT family N-acetyltransferase [Cohnella sp. AR92]|uniref:GNAT family N-acetyltransferase n=1 Tax=Cohnella sp. AR92 TaxID=648716 RepID=UPI000F8E24B4|nr:GNAT family N-acetyltransferase [Cohnella sp. AR92]RUS45849.1 GNAT family N-acetyltransferase [Cohnella sp. AR92]
MIRISQSEDFEQVFQLFHQLWPGKELNHSKLREIFDNSLTTKSNILLSAVEQEIVGFGSMVILNNFWQEARIGYLTTLIVDNKYRGKGLGKKLINTFCEIAKNNGCTKLELDSGFHRAQAHEFYERNGFERRAYLFSKNL